METILVPCNINGHQPPRAVYPYPKATDSATHLEMELDDNMQIIIVTTCLGGGWVDMGQT